VADKTVEVKDRPVEKSAVIGNILMTSILMAGGWFGDSVVDHLQSINTSMTSALESIARIQEVTKGHSNDINSIKIEQKQVGRDIYDLKLGQNSIIDRLESYDRDRRDKISISSND